MSELSVQELDPQAHDTFWRGISGTISMLMNDAAQEFDECESTHENVKYELLKSIDAEFNTLVRHEQEPLKLRAVTANMSMVIVNAASWLYENPASRIAFMYQMTNGSHVWNESGGWYLTQNGVYDRFHRIHENGISDLSLAGVLYAIDIGQIITAPYSARIIGSAACQHSDTV